MLHQPATVSFKKRTKNDIIGSVQRGAGHLTITWSMACLLPPFCKQLNNIWNNLPGLNKKKDTDNNETVGVFLILS